MKVPYLGRDINTIIDQYTPHPSSNQIHEFKKYTYYNEDRKHIDTRYHKETIRDLIILRNRKIHILIWYTSHFSDDNHESLILKNQKVYFKHSPCEHLICKDFISVW